MWTEIISFLGEVWTESRLYIIQIQNTFAVLSHDDVTLAVAKSKRKYPDIFQDI